MPLYCYTLQYHDRTQIIDARLSHVNVYESSQLSLEEVPARPGAKMILIDRGEIGLSFHDQTASMKENDLILVNPGNANFSIHGRSTPVRMISLGVENLYFRELGGRGKVLSIDDPEECRNLRSIYQSILREADRQEDDYVKLCNIYLQILLIRLKRSHGIRWFDDSEEKKEKGCRLVKDYLDRNYKKRITLDLLSEKSNMNKYYLVHTFTKLYGCSPISYLNEKRIEESKHLLDNSDLSIAQIAAELGFSSQSYFSQVFRKNTFMTPNEYRRSAGIL